MAKYPYRILCVMVSITLLWLIIILPSSLLGISEEESALMDAVNHGNLFAVRMLVESGVSVHTGYAFQSASVPEISPEGQIAIHNYIEDNMDTITVIASSADYNNLNALMLACRAGNMDIIQYLIQRGASINSINENGKSPLIFASDRGYLEVVRYLVGQGADIALVDNYGRNALDYASESGHHEVVRFLNDYLDIHNIGLSLDSILDQQIQDLVYQDDKTGLNNLLNLHEWNPTTIPLIQNAIIIYACRDGRLDLIEEMVLQGADLNRRMSYGMYKGATPLMIAVYHHQLEIIQFLIENQAMIEAKNHQDSTVLISAAQMGTQTILEYLINQGADVNVQNLFGRTALMEAVRCHHSSIIRTLIEHGARINLQDNDGKSALMFTLIAEDVRCLINNGAQVNIRDNQRNTALCLAAEAGSYNIVQLLLQHQAAINVKNREGQTPLMLAVMSGNLALVNLLLNEGALVNMQDNNGRTALMLSSMVSYPEIAQTLVQAGTDLNITDQQGKTALILAEERDNQTILALLQQETDHELTID